jgi:hypothetical protein
MSAVTLELDSEDCVRILQECGYLAPIGPRFVDLLKIPDGLNAEETETYLREHGDMLAALRMNTTLRRLEQLEQSQSARIAAPIHRVRTNG